MIRIADRYVLDKLTISRALGGLHYGVTEDLFASKSRLTQNFPQADFWRVWPSVVQLPAQSREAPLVHFNDYPRIRPKSSRLLCADQWGIQVVSE